MELHVGSFREDYRTLLEWILERGDPVAPRGQPTIEILDAVLVLEDPTDVLLTGINRQVNLRLAALEALQLIGGFSDPQLMVKAAPNTAQFLDHGVFRGAYGLRLQPQLPHVVKRLVDDRDSRQAVVTIWDPAQDLYVEGTKDYPCTVMLQFLIRRGELIMHTTMRSNDAWWGLTYDIVQFTQLQLTVADALRLPCGPYHHHAVSLHVYERDLEAITNLRAPTGEAVKLAGISCGFRTDMDPLSRLQLAMLRARDIGRGDTIKHPTAAEQWFIDRMERIRNG